MASNSIVSSMHTLPQSSSITNISELSQQEGQAIFAFKLGVGEVIKGWDIGVAGITAGGERRLTIPASLAYGKKALPDIPANSDLVFDIKCIAVS